jgi:hypothetical protein
MEVIDNIRFRINGLPLPNAERLGDLDIPPGGGNDLLRLGLRVQMKSQRLAAALGW